MLDVCPTPFSPQGVDGSWGFPPNHTAQHEGLWQNKVSQIFLPGFDTVVFALA